MESDNVDAQKHDPENEDQLKNVNPSREHGLSKSRNLFGQKDPQRFSVLGGGKWLQIVKSSPKVSCEVSTSPSHFLSKVGENYKAESWIQTYQAEKMHEKVISLASKTFKSPSIDISQGILQFTMSANGSPRFVFKLENEKDMYVASLSSNVEGQSVLDYSYIIHLQRGGSSSSSSSHLVGSIKVSTLFSGASSNERIIEREFVLFSSNGEHPQRLPFRKKNRGLSQKLADVRKNYRSISRLRCSWDQQFQEPIFENNLSRHVETLAVVVRQEFLEEETGGWGLKFLKKSPLVQTGSGSSRCLTTSMDVLIPSGIHGGPENGPSSLIERWKSQGNCDCGGWDLGCSLTLLKGQPRKDNLFELFIEGSKRETPGLRIVSVSRGLYFVQFQERISVLQSFSIALAFVHSQSQELQPLL